MVMAVENIRGPGIVKKSSEGGDWCLGLKWTCQMFLHKRRCHKEMMDDRDFTSSSLEHHRSLLVISIAIQYRGMNGINIMLMLSSICILINIIRDLTTIFFFLVVPRINILRIIWMMYCNTENYNIYNVFIYNIIYYNIIWIYKIS